ncbi:MAG: hypothetical protein WC593_04185 [Methanoregula sp.]
MKGNTKRMEERNTMKINGRVTIRSGLKSPDRDGRIPFDPANAIAVGITWHRGASV